MIDVTAFAVDVALDRAARFGTILFGRRRVRLCALSSAPFPSGLKVA